MFLDTFVWGNILVVCVGIGLLYCRLLLCCAALLQTVYCPMLIIVVRILTLSNMLSTSSCVMPCVNYLVTHVGEGLVKDS